MHAVASMMTSAYALYVGDLASDTTEEMLYHKFSRAGQIVSIRILRDVITKCSLGYAFVNFQRQEDAETALNTMNFDMIKGRPCRIMWLQLDHRKYVANSVLVKNIDKAIDKKALYDTFSAFGNILSCKVVTDEHGVSKGYGFVQFETKESADMAAEKVDGMLLNDKKISVVKFTPRKQKRLHTTQKFTNVYVKNFGKNFTETQLKEIFLPYGNIVSQRIMLDNVGRSRGFGFVNFDSHKSAAHAVDDLNGKVMPNGKRLYCNRAQKKRERLVDMRRGVNLYVKNLDDEIDDDRLRREFSKFGTITSVKVMTNRNGESKGFGFVCFKSPEEATEAFTKMNGRIIVAKPLFITLAQRKEERKAQLAAQRQRSVSTKSKYKPQTQMRHPWRFNNPYPHNVPVHQPHATSISDRIRARTTHPSTHRVLQWRNKVTQSKQFSTTELSAATTQQQKQLLGERLYHLVKQTHPEQAGKITGMLLQMDNSEILHMLDSHESLQLKVHEAVAVLRAHQKNHHDPLQHQTTESDP